MIYLLLLTEAFFLFLLLLLLFSMNKNLSEDLALAIATSLFLSVCALLCTGILFSLNFWSYLIFKFTLITAILLFFKTHDSPPLKEAYPRLQRKWQRLIRSPLHLLVLFFFLLLFLNSFGRFPVEWDSYSYHLPMASAFLKKGILAHYQYYGVSIGAYYPHSIELLYSLFFSIKGIEQSSLVNFPSLVLMFLGLYLLAHRCLKINPEVSLLGSLAFIFIPVVQTYFYEAYVDIYFLSFCLLGLYCLFQLYHRRQNRYLLFLLLLASLMVSTRYQGLSYTLYFGIAVFVFLLKYRFWKKLDWRLALFLPAGLFVSTFFYIRNYILTQNPCFPTHMNFLGFIQFPGPYDFSVLASQTSILFTLPQIADDIFPTLLNELSAGLLLFVFLWISSLLGMKKTRRNLAGDTSFKIFILIGLFLLISFLLTPYSGLNTAGGFNLSLRLGLFFLALLFMISLKLAISAEIRPLAFVLLFFAVGLFLLGKQFSGRNFLWALGALLLLWGLASFKRACRFGPAYPFLFLALLALFRPPLQNWENYFWDDLQLRNIHIAYAGTNRHFQLYDKYLTYTIRTINVNRQQAQKWNQETDLSYHKSYGNFEIWLQNMRSENIDYIVLYERDRKYIENTWVRENPRLFPREIQNIFRVNKKEVEKYLASQD
ncbi:MAG: glycosyltransferase family 39 protein [Candidatus Aminicenantales bacterium]